eukprot:CAMPEP_0119021844 /NCGR_PEP_ID=MMETSP1176-20130426/26825_1 /TAXON_ID=265551 /ORGANISM="Synedropsis recta cf, Strain CCMP1620" /LENGTH=46 /DNA_ID= /DNA_START= /DNA_END= /DNA_ORIENTATION=
MTSFWLQFLSGLKGAGSSSSEGGPLGGFGFGFLSSFLSSLSLRLSI